MRKREPEVNISHHRDTDQMTQRGGTAMGKREPKGKTTQTVDTGQNGIATEGPEWGSKNPWVTKR